MWDKNSFMCCWHCRHVFLLRNIYMWSTSTLVSASWFWPRPQPQSLGLINDLYCVEWDVKLYYTEICKRSARFILSCIQSESSFVRSTVRYGIFVGRCNSFIGRNVLLLCPHFKWQFNYFICGNVSLNNYEFLHNFYTRVGNDDWSAAQLLAEILRIRDEIGRAHV